MVDIARAAYCRTLFAIVTVLASAIPAAAGPILYQAFAHGAARELEHICAGCDNPTRDLFNTSNGQPGDTVAAVSQGGASTALAGATSALMGLNQLPVLGAGVSVNVVVDPNPRAPRVFMYSANASAIGIQLFRFLGSEPEFYVLDYTIDGAITGGPTNAALNNNGIAGGITVYQGLLDDSGGEEGAQPIHGASHQTAKGTGQLTPVHMGGNVGFWVEPFDGFTVHASLGAFATSTVDGSPGGADASHTMTLSFSQGNTALLQPASAVAVPEPGTALLLISGLAASAAARRRRRLAPPSRPR